VEMGKFRILQKTVVPSNLGCTPPTYVTMTVSPKVLKSEVFASRMPFLSPANSIKELKAE